MSVRSFTVRPAQCLQVEVFVPRHDLPGGESRARGARGRRTHLAPASVVAQQRDAGLRQAVDVTDRPKDARHAARRPPPGARPRRSPRTGTPQAIASSALRPNDSRSEGSRKRSADCEQRRDRVDAARGSARRRSTPSVARLLLGRRRGRGRRRSSRARWASPAARARRRARRPSPASPRRKFEMCMMILLLLAELRRRSAGACAARS